jgi:hypothetical protein
MVTNFGIPSGETLVKKTAISILALVTLASVSSLPASAENDFGGMAKSTAMFPVRTAALGAGLVVGTPVAILRRVSNRCTEYTGNFADKIGGKDNLPPVLFASILGVPFGLVSGTAEGVYFGGKNAISNCVEHPFSKDSFSLGDELE